MTESPPRMVVLTDTDLDFVVSEAAQDAADADRLKLLIDEDEQFRAAILGDEKVFQRLMADEETFLMVSPALYFEVLLRQSLRDLETAGYTVERDGRADLPVFDTQDVVKFLSIRGVLDYLAHMLASFTRINSYAVPVRIRRGIRRRVVYNDMDIDSLVRHCATPTRSSASASTSASPTSASSSPASSRSSLRPPSTTPSPAGCALPYRTAPGAACRTTRRRASSSTAWPKTTTQPNTWG